MSDVVLHADHLIAGYIPGINILNGCTMEVQDGELIGIIGPNGAGKSTFLKALFGLVPVTEGTVTLAGEDITNLRADQLVRRGVGFVPQTNNVFPSLTILENMEMGAFQAPKKINEQFDRIVEIFPVLGERRNQRCASLSGGHSPVPRRPGTASRESGPAPCTPGRGASRRSPTARSSPAPTRRIRRTPGSPSPRPPPTPNRWRTPR